MSRYLLDTHAAIWFFTIVPIETTHLTFLKDLPFIHRDPFDRFLIATALAENMTLITADENITRYNVHCVW